MAKNLVILLAIFCFITVSFGSRVPRGSRTPPAPTSDSSSSEESSEELTENRIQSFKKVLLTLISAADTEKITNFLSHSIRDEKQREKAIEVLHLLMDSEYGKAVEKIDSNNSPKTITITTATITTSAAVA